MGLIEQQQALAELFTNDSARRELLLRGEGLGVVGENGIEQQDQFNQEIIDFADSLIKKRLGQIKQHIPGTCVILRSRLEEIFQGFAKDEPTTGVRRHLYDSQMFMAYLELNYQELLVSKIDKYIFKYERIWLKAILSNRYINISIFPFDVAKAIKINSPVDGRANIFLGPPRICIWLKSSEYSEIIYREFFPRFWPLWLTSTT